MMSSDSDEVSDSLDREDSDVTDIANLISLRLSSTNALDTLFFRALWVMSIPFACNDAITCLHKWSPFISLLPPPV